MNDEMCLLKDKLDKKIKLKKDYKEIYNTCVEIDNKIIENIKSK